MFSAPRKHHPSGIAARVSRRAPAHIVSRHAAAAIVAGSLLLSACGGGGGDTSVVIPVVIQTQPSSTTVVSGTVARFSISATGDNLSFRWEVSTNNGSTWTTVQGATSPTLELTGVSVAFNGYMYRAVVTGTSGSVESGVVTLRVDPSITAPSIVSNIAASATVVEGSQVALAITAAGTLPTYQWQQSTDALTWSDIAGATGPSFTLQSVTTAQTGLRIRALVSNSAATVASNTLTLEVTPASAPPTFLQQPNASSVVAPNAASFSVQATGTPAPSIQWQRSTDGINFTDIAGATTANYSTGATTTVEDGQRYRVILINSAGSAVSDPVQLRVSAAATAPVFASQPQSVAANAGALATFSATVSGNPTPALQWQLSTDGGATYSNITGAQSSSYTTSALNTSDSGRRYRVQAQNQVASVFSSAATLTVNPVTSVLNGKAWTAGQSLESGDSPVLKYKADIDDAGRVMVLFVKSNGTRNALWARLGTAGGAGTAPIWTSAVEVDAQAPLNSGDPINVAMSPSGNAVATWTRTEACTSSSYITITSSRCDYRYAATYSASSGQWSTPMQVASTPSTAGTILQMNDRGDLLIQVRGWVRSGTRYSEREGSVTWKAAGATSFTQQHLSDANITLKESNQHLDKDGNIAVVGLAAQALTEDIVAYRGTVSTGVGQQEKLETRSSAATLHGSWGGRNGQVVVLWNQNNGTRDTRFAATLDNPTGPWSAPTELSLASEHIAGSSPFYARVTAAGDFVQYRNTWVVRRVSGVWGSYQKFNDWGAWNPYYTDVALNTDASALILRTDNGGCCGTTQNGWATFDGPTQSLLKALPTTTAASSGYLLGTPSKLDGITLLSNSGIGAFISVSDFDTLPTPQSPAGDARRDVSNLWGFFFK